MKKISLSFIVIAALITLGAYYMLRNGQLLFYIIPIAIVAVILLLLKFPPKKWKLKGKTNRSAMSDEQRYKEAVKKQKQQMKQKQSTSNSQPKTLPFKVIEGGRDDNDTPRYH